MERNSRRFGTERVLTHLLILIWFLYQKEDVIVDLKPCLTQSSTVEPTCIPVTLERKMTTRAAASVIAS